MTLIPAVVGASPPLQAPEWAVDALGERIAELDTARAAWFASMASRGSLRDAAPRAAGRT